MADRLAVGLAKSVVVGAITKVQSVIEEDAKLREKVKRDLVSITLEFEMMQSFLDDANEEMKSKVVRTWVKHIRQLAYDVEDCVENVVQLDDKPVFWRRLLPSCMVEPLQLDQAVEEIEQLKGRVEEVNNCYRRYNLINESVGSSKPAVVIHQPQPPVPGASDMLCKARDATQRRQGTFGDLTRLISKEDNKLQVISLWGSASDHGTTSIIRETFTHSEICQDFTYRAWVKLMHPFSPYGFIRSLMAQFYANSCKEENAATAGMHVLMKMEAAQAHLFNEFKQLILEKKYLIVLEGLSTMVDWDTIRTFLPDKKNGSCIILSTQEPEIASLCVGHFYDILEFKKFSDDHSVCVLFKEPPVDEARQSSPSGKKMKDAEQWMEDNLLVGRESQINELRRCLAGARFPNSQVVSVWGMAGIGKSHLIRYLYFNRMFHTKQFQKYSWVDVPHPFNLRGFSRSLLLDLFSEEDPIKQCRELLEQYQCLVVIDNLRSKEEWDLIQAALLSRRSSSVIIVITTEASIASYCTNIEANVNVRCLDDDAAFDLFRQEVCLQVSFV
uniref:Disease resistance protein RPM1 n=1 Tax=Aegilops tauschii TaxID=37682 RepID=M8C9Z2_AEGTA